MIGRGSAVVLAMLIVTPFAARGQEVAQPVPADGKCAVPADEKNWTKQEIFVWKRVCIGKEADFNKEPGYGGDLDPKKPGGLPENRVLRSSFLETILLKNEYRRALTRRGVRIIGARFTEAVDLENAELGHELRLERSILEQGADLSGLKSMHEISLIGSKVTGRLNMNGLQAVYGLFMREQAEFVEVDLRAARVGLTLDLSGSKVTRELNMNGLRVDGSLFMSDKAEFKEVDLGHAHIGATLDLSGSKVTGKLDMNGLNVAEDLFMNDIMNDKAEFAEVNLVGAHVGGLLNLSGSKVTGELNMEALQVGETVFLGRGAEFSDPIDLIFGKIGGSLELAGGIFHKGMDLTGTQISAELRLGSSVHPPAQWLENEKEKENPTLILRNAKADAIQDLSNAWPDSLDLNGFAYRSLGGIYAAKGDPMAERSVEWFEKEWLGKQDHYTPQPYEQLAAVLRAQGRPETADDILYAGRERERDDTLKRWRDDHDTSDLFRWLWLTALDLLIGYGYHIEWTLGWVVGFVLIGWGVLWITGQRRRHEVNIGLAYSLDMLLPLVRLREKHYGIDLDLWPRRYFYLHKIVGYILASFLIAGISGLTK